MKTSEEDRKQFEDWLSLPPFEYSIKRLLDAESMGAWPGQYKDIVTQMAWQAWQEGNKAGLTEAAEIAAKRSGYNKFQEYNQAIDEAFKSILAARDNKTSEPCCNICSGQHKDEDCLK